MAQRVLIDACVLFSPLLRTLVLEMASAGLFRPIWSERILDEWRLSVVRKHGLDTEPDVIAAQTLMNQRFPEACVSTDVSLDDQITLPDPADVHVLCAAIDGRADVLMTLNLRDFPQLVLARYGINAVHPDSFLWMQLSSHEALIHKAASDALQACGIEANRRRTVLKRTKLPRFAKALEASVGDSPTLRG